MTLTETTRGDDVWYVHAKCHGEDPELFFTESKENRAKTICRTCPVIEQCLKAALREERGTAYRYGVRGGLTPWERRVRAGHRG